QGAWLFHSPFTSETLPGIVLYPWYLWPAHLLGWAAGPWLYHLARLAAAAALLAAVFLLIGELFRPQLLRRWAFLLCVVRGGAGALVQLPYLIYLFWVWRATPAALSVIRPVLEVGDPFGFLVLSHLIASGLIAVAIWRGRLRGDLLLPALWIVGMTIFMFVPGISGVLGRSFMASSIPFGLCATPGLLSLLRGVRSL